MKRPQLLIYKEQISLIAKCREHESYEVIADA